MRQQHREFQFEGMASERCLIALKSLQWSCSELAGGMKHLVRAKEELSEEDLCAEVQDSPIPNHI